jgi:predicted  nucleic acid-binding Zn-ribbon protein
MFSEITSTTSGSTQTWAAVATALAGAVAAAFAKKKYSQSKIENRKSKMTAVSHSDLQTGLDQMRDRVAAGYLALGQKMDSSQKEILSAIADHSSTVEKRLDALESAVARLDERTKLAA